MSFGFLSRRDAGPNKCPRCSRIGVDFAVVGEGLLGCFDCGCVFIAKAYRVKPTVVPFPVKVSSVSGGKAVSPLSVTSTPPEGVAEDKPEPVADKIADPVIHICPVCAKVLKTKLALSGHMRSHAGA